MNDNNSTQTGNVPTAKASAQPAGLGEARVLGHAPRIEPLHVTELTSDLLGLVERMTRVNIAINARRKEELIDFISDQAAGVSEADISAHVANLSEIVRTMLRHPDLFTAQTDIGIQLLGNGTLTPRDRELAILRIGWLCQAPYEWGEHVHVAKAVGITSEEIERVTQGSSAPGWSEHERAIMRAVEELHANAIISDETWATLAKTLNDKQLIELPIVIGQYQTVAYYQNSLRLRLHDGNLGLKAR
ncbi:MAG TPA: carboxymuconolactone decarboxylase family protein [Spongiibacteraceae bacterium]|nr:carboxymuconolactone decarboxylase family protein [Spongiibacteraceae bacterium]